MSFTQLRPIPSVDEILASAPLTADLAAVKAARDREIHALFEADGTRFLIIVGPCSAHDEEAVCDYVARLAKVQDAIKERCCIIPRIYTTKPRTTGLGYKGMVHQPDPRGETNVADGIRAIRRMHLRALRESHLTAAEEMLYPDNHAFLDDVLSYVVVGARSVENQQHRLTASGLSMPVGMKNPRCGDLSVAFYAINAAQQSHEFSYHGWDVRTSGNPYAHLVLRGLTDCAGSPVANYRFDDLKHAAEEYEKRHLSHPAIIVDVSHDNSGRRYSKQPAIALDVLTSRKRSPLLEKQVRGVMIESFITEGNQRPDETAYGKSITDPCLGWPETEKLLREIAERC